MTTKTILVAGYGPGISRALAETFGKEGFQVALAARSEERLDAGVKELEALGVKAKAFRANLADAGEARALVGRVRETFGPLTVLQWNAYSGGAGDVLAAPPEELRATLDVATTSLVAAIQAALPDLERAGDGAVLVTNGGLGFYDAQVDAMGVAWNAMGLSMANAAKHKLVGLLAKKLAPKNVYVGEVVVLGAVKGTAFDDGSSKLEASAVAQAFLELYRAREASSRNVG